MEDALTSMHLNDGLNHTHKSQEPRSGYYEKGKAHLDVFHRSEGLLPKLQVAGNPQLLKARLQIHLQRLRDAEIWPVALVLPPERQK